MNELYDYIKTAAIEYGYNEEREKVATSIQAVRNATAHVIRNIRSLGDAAGVSRKMIKPLVNTKLQKASNIMNKGLFRMELAHHTAFAPNNKGALDVQNLKDIIAFKGKPITGMKTINSSASQMGRMIEPKAPFSSGRYIDGRGLQMPRIKNTQRITGPNMREKFKLLNY